MTVSMLPSTPGRGTAITRASSRLAHLEHRVDFDGLVVRQRRDADREARVAAGVAEDVADELGSAVVYRMETHGIIAMPVLDGDDKVVGVIHLHDLMRAGVV